ncbi:hypothetical protein [Massilia luteola]|uniref:hypothetical protein n=1 Tax=Massilia luteola TaxID=3081751 RepID=UPI002ACC200F|nr:hypothetical protein [Massilia sp. Gc5]
MSYPRQTRVLSAVVALLSLLFMQLAVAAYACPNVAPARSAPMLDGAGQPMADCRQTDRQSPTLCHEHAHKLIPSLDKPDAPFVMPFIAAGIALLLWWPDHAVAAPNPPRVFLHASGSSPPLAIRHCCFRL